MYVSRRSYVSIGTSRSVKTLPFCIFHGMSAPFTLTVSCFQRIVSQEDSASSDAGSLGVFTFHQELQETLKPFQVCIPCCVLMVFTQ